MSYQHVKHISMYTQHISFPCLECSSPWSSQVYLQCLFFLCLTASYSICLFFIILVVLTCATRYLKFNAIFCDNLMRPVDLANLESNMQSVFVCFTISWFCTLRHFIPSANTHHTFLLQLYFSAGIQLQVLLQSF